MRVWMASLANSLKGREPMILLASEYTSSGIEIVVRMSSPPGASQEYEVYDDEHGASTAGFNPVHARLSWQPLSFRGEKAWKSANRRTVFSCNRSCRCSPSTI